MAATSAPGALASMRAELGALGRWRRYAARRPEWWLPAAAGLAWTVLAVAFLRGAHDPGIGWWAVMVVAMMLPLVRSQARWLAFRSLRERRQAAVAAFVLSFVLAWVAAGAVLLAVLTSVRGDLAALAAALAVAAAWQVALPRRRILRRCGAMRAPAIRGPQAVADWLRSGASSGARCVMTCWALMAPMAIVHHPAVMGCAAYVAFAERSRAPNPDTRGASPLEAAVLAGAALGVGLLVVTGSA